MENSTHLFQLGQKPEWTASQQSCTSLLQHGRSQKTTLECHFKKTNKKKITPFEESSKVQDGCLDLSVKWFFGWTDVKMSSWAFVCFSTFLSISSGMVTRLTPRLWPGFLDLHSPIKALDLGLMVGLTSWRPEPGRSGPERAGFGWNGSGWWVGGFYMLLHK